MKRIEDIERLTDGELEKIALDESIPVPAGLKERLEASLEESPSLRSRWITGLSVAAAAVIATVLLLPGSGSSELKDTFDDPYLAYAEVERTFNKISEKMSEAKDKTLEAASTIEKPISIIRKINK